MNTQDKLKEVFAESLAIKPDQVTNDLKYSEHPSWDSIAHMSLVAAIENAFDIMIDAEDVIDMSSFGKAIEIVEKYL